MNRAIPDASLIRELAEATQWTRDDRLAAIAKEYGDGFAASVAKRVEAKRARRAERDRRRAQRRGRL